MRFPFLELPGGLLPRPIVCVIVSGLRDVPQFCLIDSGALRNRFGSWVAEAAGVTLDDAPAERLAVGGLVTEGRMARVDLELSGTRFDAAVWFCDPWPFSFNLLGQEGFFRFFHLELCSADGWLELTPEPHSGGTPPAPTMRRCSRATAG